MRRIALCWLLLSAGAAQAGDSSPLVADRPAAQCSVRDARFTETLSSASVAAEVRGALTDRRAVIPGWLSNGRLTFCTAAERRAFERVLVEIGAQPVLARERAWADLLRMRRTASLRMRLRAVLTRCDLAARARARLRAVLSTLK